MEQSTFSLESLLIVAVLALLVPLLVSRIRAVRIPIVVGEILVGVVVGKSGFNIIQTSQWLQFLQFFGLAYLMFVSGLELDFKTLRPNKHDEVEGLRGFLTNAPMFALISCVLTFGMSILLSLWLHQHHFIKSPFLVALIITTTSLTVVVPVLKEYDLLQNSFGQLLMAAAMFADFVTMLLISVAASLYQGGLSPRVFLVFILIFILLLLYRAFRHFAKYQSLRNLADGTAQLGIRASMALMIIFIVLAQTLGVQVILGTFLAGILVGLVNEQSKSDVFNKLDAIGFGFLIPIFFIMVGVDFDIRSLFSDPKALLLLPLLFIATYVFKGLPILLLRLRYPWRHTLSGAALLTTQMSVTVAAAAVGLKIGAISPGVDTAIILVAMLTAIISPVLFGKLLPPKIHGAEKQIVVIGNSPGAQLLVDQVKERGQRFVWVQTMDESTISMFEEADNGDKGDDVDRREYAVDKASVMFARLGVNPATTKCLIAYTGSDSQNVTLSKAVASLGVESSICFIRDVTLFQTYSQAEQFVVVNPQLAAVTLIDQLMNYPASTQLLKAPGSMQIQEVRLTSHALHGLRLMDIDLPGNLLVMSIFRDGTQIVPHGQTGLSVGDTVVVVGRREDIADFIRMAEDETI
ncbi:cation:proton antiporter domain-containing protein [Alicyclobacillus mengziensis]|uniref:Cation:proton antiporter n=1 Tax=Alicyclobacillus mengziensis TaxID=2931921 RepID=A0A9X7W1N3_9BACL|nr:cation:proton antiporter [Alicyclobacillus mengziensis]QSO47693.1 cation:proton antiporter [Alicyclobacillus mengziensis]